MCWSGRFGLKDEELGLHHGVSYDNDYPSRNVRKSVRDAGLNGKGKVQNGEETLGVPSIEIILKAMGTDEVTKGSRERLTGG